MNAARVTAAAALLASLALVGTTAAIAATPGQIYRDYADNGRLDGNYTPAELKAALKDAVIQQYGGPAAESATPTIKKFVAKKAAVKKAVVKKAAPQKAAPKKAAAFAPAPVKKTGPLPFTGLDLALITIGGISMLLLGAGVRRFARRSV
jgi:hypothetical protein